MRSCVVSQRLSIDASRYALWRGNTNPPQQLSLRTTCTPLHRAHNVRCICSSTESPDCLALGNVTSRLWRPYSYTR
eukprot:2253950-Prymnesium_polylepis.1